MKEKNETNPQEEIAATPKAITSEEQAIAARVATADTGWETIREDDLNDFSLMTNPLDLPPECAVRQERHEYAYRWAEMKPQRIDELRNLPGPMRWEIVNRTTAPYLSPKKFDPVHGGVQVLDQILLYKPWRMFEAVQKAKQDLAENLDQSGDLKKRNGMVDQDRGVEYLSGSKHRIRGDDEILADEAELDRENGISDDISDLDDLIVNE